MFGFSEASLFPIGLKYAFFKNTCLRNRGKPWPGVSPIYNQDKP